jgi:hypothetical protein
MSRMLQRMLRESRQKPGEGEISLLRQRALDPLTDFLELCL